MKKKAAAQPPPPSAVQNQAFANADADRTAGNATIDTAKQGFSPYMAGSDGMSEFRRALTGNLARSTANTGDNAIARSRERAQAAGFGGGGQPMQFGAENELANEQAGRIASIPGQVEQIAAPLELQAAGATAGIGESQMSDARGYFGQGVNEEDQRMQEFYKQQEEARKRKAGIWGALAKIGLNAGLGFATGGLSLPFTAAASGAGGTDKF